MRGRLRPASDPTGGYYGHPYSNGIWRLTNPSRTQKIKISMIKKRYAERMLCPLTRSMSGYDNATAKRGSRTISSHTARDRRRRGAGVKTTMKRQNRCAGETVDTVRYSVYEAGGGLTFKPINSHHQIFQKIGQIHAWCIARSRFASDAEKPRLFPSSFRSRDHASGISACYRAGVG